MSVWIKKLHVQEVLLGFVLIGCIYLSFCFSAIEHIDRRFMLLHLLMAAAGGAVYLALCRKIMADAGVFGQFLMWNTLYSVCAVVFLGVNIGYDIRNGMWYELISQIVFAAIAVGAEYVLLHSGRSHGMVRDKMKEFLNKRKYLFLLCAAGLLLAYDPDMVQFKWDGSTYYEANLAASIYSIGKMALYGHIAHTFSAMNLFLGAVFGHHLEYGIVCANMVIYVVSICAFYGVLKYILPETGELQRLIGTAIYAFSPFVLGMVNYYNLDFHCMCLFTVVLYYTVKKQWLLQVIFGLFFSFTKEPAIFIYGMLCIGVVLNEVLFEDEGSVMVRIKNQFIRARNYAFLSVALLWVLTVALIGFWGGEGGFQIDGAYMAEKLKVLCILNFGWVFTAIIVCGGSVLLVRRKMRVEKRGWMFPLLLGGMGYILFNCLFKTINHPRYVSIVPVFLYILAVYLLVQLLWKEHCRWLTGILSVLAALMLISSFCTIDPLSKRVFRTFPIGSSVMVSTGIDSDRAPGDAVIYNKEMLWLERALCNAMEGAIEAENTIIFPVFNNGYYYFNGFVGVAGAGHVGDGEYRHSTQYWNGGADRREMIPSERNESFDVYEVTNAQALETLFKKVEFGRAAYFYLEFGGEEIADAIRARYRVVQEQEFRYRGWIVYEVVFEGGAE